MMRHESTEILTTAFAKAGAVSIVTGREYTTLMTDQCNARLDIESVAQSDQPIISTEHDGTVSGQVNLSVVPAIVSGSIVNGSVAAVLPTLVHLSSAQTFTPKDAKMHDTGYQTLLQTANLYREFGHDTEWTMLPDRNTLRPFGAVHTCVIDTGSLHYIHDQVYCALRGISYGREGRSSPIPPLQALMDEKISVKKWKPTITMTMWDKIHTPLPVIRHNYGTIQPVTFKIRSNASSARVLLRAVKHISEESGFHEIHTVKTPAPQKPVQQEEITDVGTVATATDA